MSKKYPDGMTLEQAKTFVMPFGKYKGDHIIDIFLEDESYIEWAHAQLGDNDDLKLAIDLACYTKDD